MLLYVNEVPGAYALEDCQTAAPTQDSIGQPTIAHRMQPPHLGSFEEAAACHTFHDEMPTPVPGENRLPVPLLLPLALSRPDTVNPSLCEHDDQQH